MTTKILFLGLLGVVAVVEGRSQESQQVLPRERFEVGGHPAFVILPAKGKPKRDGSIPWVLYAPTFDGKLPRDRDEGWMMRRWLDVGIAVAGVDIGESYGSPAGCTTYEALHKMLVEKYGFDPQACLLARSRGGLMLYCWAVEHPEKVRCIAGIYPVCDIASYPGVGKACRAYGMTEAELAAKLEQHNPIPRLAALAKAQVPIFHIHGDKDKVVPLEANSAALAEAYRKLGGSMQLTVAPGQGHNMWRGFFECRELADFVIANATGKPNVADVPKPIAHWMLDGTDGNIAKDSAGDHHGKIVGATVAEGVVNKARQFDRPRGNHISIPYASDFALSTFTVSSWVKLTRPPTFSGILGTRFGGEHTFDMKVNDAKVHGDIGDGDRWIEKKVNFYADDTGTDGQGGDLNLERWYHIAYVIDAEEGRCRLYLNGDLKKMIPFEGKPLFMKPGQRLHIGHSSGDEFMDGLIDDVKIWASALSDAEVAKLAKH